MSALIGMLDEQLVDAIREGDALKIAELRAKLDIELEQERRVTLNNAAKCLIASREIRIRLN